MAMTRGERISGHKKQERLQINKSGAPPLVAELTEGVPVIRSTDEGIVQYLRYNNELYKNIFSKSVGISSVAFSGEGYLTLLNGFILQWGQVTASSSNETVEFPIPFPNECLNVICTDYDSSDADGTTSATGISTLPTTTQVVFTCYTAVDTFFWQAIGY